MLKRLWIPVAVVLVVLLAATVIAGTMIRGRLADAQRALDPFTSVALVEGPATLDVDDLPGPTCGVDDDQIVRAWESFHAAVDADEDDPDTEVVRATFDSFLLQSAISRLSAGDHQLTLRARAVDGSWCLDEAELALEE